MNKGTRRIIVPALALSLVLTSAGCAPTQAPYKAECARDYDHGDSGQPAELNLKMTVEQYKAIENLARSCSKIDSVGAHFNPRTDLFVIFGPNGQSTILQFGNSPVDAFKVPDDINIVRLLRVAVSRLATDASGNETVVSRSGTVMKQVGENAWEYPTMTENLAGLPVVYDERTVDLDVLRGLTALVPRGNELGEDLAGEGDPSIYYKTAEGADIKHVVLDNIGN